ncbi:hypothetical protein DFH08DRAFT_1013239 [Mycena albidolilacea]|uniref:Uncharacterized protein n=1 Tax=Mycena albidolilacea TaxID=1033008 RepID=A0AAD6ZV64_9AGAR|nr:hypothetical protein DFH08DRAFT_1013239 [Mycena albidolilacea]
MTESQILRTTCAKGGRLRRGQIKRKGDIRGPRLSGAAARKEKESESEVRRGEKQDRRGNQGNATVRAGDSKMKLEQESNGPRGRKKRKEKKNRKHPSRAEALKCTFSHILRGARIPGKGKKKKRSETKGPTCAQAPKEKQSRTREESNRKCVAHFRAPPAGAEEEEEYARQDKQDVHDILGSERLPQFVCITWNRTRARKLWKERPELGKGQEKKSKNSRKIIPMPMREKIRQKKWERAADDGMYARYSQAPAEAEAREHIHARRDGTRRPSRDPHPSVQPRVPASLVDGWWHETGWDANSNLDNRRTISSPRYNDGARTLAVGRTDARASPK